MWPGHRRTHSHVHPKEQMSPATDLIVLCHSDWRPRKFVAPPVSILLGETFMPCMTIFRGFSRGCSIHTHTHTERWTHPLPRKFHAICYVLCEGLWCYAWESQNDRLQFIQFILLSQTFVSAASVPHFFRLFYSFTLRLPVWAFY